MPRDKQKQRQQEWRERGAGGARERGIRRRRAEQAERTKRNRQEALHNRRRGRGTQPADTPADDPPPADMALDQTAPVAAPPVAAPPVPNPVAVARGEAWCQDVYYAFIAHSGYYTTSGSRRVQSLRTRPMKVQYYWDHDQGSLDYMNTPGVRASTMMINVCTGQLQNIPARFKGPNDRLSDSYDDLKACHLSPAEIAAWNRGRGANDWTITSGLFCIQLTADGAIRPTRVPLDLPPYPVRGQPHPGMLDARVVFQTAREHWRRHFRVNDAGVEVPHACVHWLGCRLPIRIAQRQPTT